MSHRPELSELTVVAPATIRMALDQINKNAQGVVFLVDKSQKFLGLVTDGDIRRTLLEGNGLEADIEVALNRIPITLPHDSNSKKIMELLSPKIRHIPLLENGGKLVDYASMQSFHRVPIMEPFFGEQELINVTECVTSGWVSSQGKFVSQFEKDFSEYIGAPYAMTSSNGTTALHLCLESLGVGDGDEVIVPSFTFAASVNAIIYCGATPIFVDINEETWTLDPTLVEKSITSKTKAVMPVHIYGHPCHMDELMELAKEHKLFVIEDCAESLGSRYKNEHTGIRGHAAAFSFFGNKVITTGEGGMVVFKNEDHYQKAKVLRDHGMNPQKRYWHEFIGFNYRMTNMQAALGVAQLQRISDFLERRNIITKWYKKYLEGVEGISFQPLASWAKSCNWLVTILVDNRFPISRDQLIDALLKNGIDSRPVFYPIHKMPVYEKYNHNCDLPVTDDIATRGISLPSSITLDEKTVQTIASTIQSIANSEKISNSSR